MANNAIFSRLANLWTGFVSLWISDVEKEHPEIAYQNAITSMIDKYAKLKAATGAIIARRQETTSRLEAQERELATIASDLETAMATGQDDLAIVLIQKKNALDASIAELRVEAEQATNDADSAKDSLMQVKAEIDKLKAEKDRMLAQMHSAQARLKIQGQLDGLSVDAEVQALGALLVIVRTARFARLTLAGVALFITLAVVLWVRNAFGVVFLLGWAVVLGTAAQLLSANAARFVLALIAEMFCISAFNDIDYLFSDYAEVNGARHASDTMVIAQALWLPYWLWGAVIAFFSLAVAALGIAAMGERSRQPR